jgi:hypothetical protein
VSSPHWQRPFRSSQAKEHRRAEVEPSAHHQHRAAQNTDNVVLAHTVFRVATRKTPSISKVAQPSQSVRVETSR